MFFYVKGNTFDLTISHHLAYLKTVYTCIKDDRNHLFINQIKHQHWQLFLAIKFGAFMKK